MSFPVLSAMIAVPLLGGLVVYGAGKLKGDAFARYVALALCFATFGLSLVALKGFSFSIGDFQWMENYTWVKSVGISYILAVDGISMPLVLLTTFISLPAMASSWGIKERVSLHFALLLLIEAALLGVFMALDLFLFFIFWELALVPMYFLIGIWGGPRRKYAAIKFFVYTHLGGLAILLAIIAIYFKMDPHTFSLLQISQQAPHFAVGFQTIVFAALFLGFAIKMPVFPFHTWLPDAHVEAPTAGSIHLASVLLKMGGYALIRVGIAILPEGARALAPVMVALAVISGFYAAFAAMAQRDIKKLIAYSSVSHMGYVLLGIAAFNTIGIEGAIYQMVAHGLITGMLFFIAGSIHHHVGTRIIDDIKGFTKRMPIFQALIVVVFFAGFGLPGLAGFVAEFFIFLGAFQTYRNATIIIVFSIVVTAAYFLWTLQKIAFDDLHPSLKDKEFHDIDFWTEVVPIGITVFLIVLLGVYPAFLVNMMEPSVLKVAALFAGG